MYMWPVYYHSTFSLYKQWLYVILIIELPLALKSCLGHE